MFTVSSNFIGNFKTGDNIAYNLRLLRLLYAQYSAGTEDEKALLRKPIIITLVSITEAMLHDLHMRVQSFTIEGVRNLANSIIGYIRGKKLEEFESTSPAQENTTCLICRVVLFTIEWMNCAVLGIECTYKTRNVTSSRMT